jgi:uncharacterized protein YjbI with pentapeptide repeats
MKVQELFDQYTVGRRQFPYEYFAGEDLVGLDLSGATMYGSKFRGADMRDIILVDAVILECDFRGADMRNAALRGANMLRANLRGADLRGADLRDAGLMDAYLFGADLYGAIGVDDVPRGPIPGLAKRVLQQITEHPESWDQKVWHCRTRHCIAGWAVVLAGEIGKAAEDRLGTEMAAAMLLGTPSHKFFAPDYAALEWLMGLASPC